MKILESQVTKIEITDLVRSFNVADIVVILEELPKDTGRIAITCFDQTLTAYFDAMGGKQTAEFFCICEDDYLADAFRLRQQYGEYPPRYVSRIIQAVKKALSDTKDLSEALKRCDR